MNKFLRFTIFISVFIIILSISPNKASASVKYDTSKPPTLSWIARNDTWYYVYDNEVHNSGVFAVGTDDYSFDGKWIIEKRNLTTGELIPVFGTNGVITEDISSSLDIAYSVVAVGNYVYIAGYDSDTVGNNGQWRIEKRNVTTGQLIDSFGTSGVVSSNPSDVGDALQVILYNNNTLYLGGSDGQEGVSDAQWRIEKRDATTGDLIDAFGTHGVVTDNISSTSEIIVDMALNGTNLYIIGTDASDGGEIQWLVQKRNITSGNLVTGFGVNGELNIDPRDATGNEYPYGIAVDNNAFYPAGQESVSALDFKWHTEKRNLSDGSIVSNFGTNGIVTYDYSGGGFYDRVFDVTVDGTDLYLVGDAYSLSGGATLIGRIEKRDTTSGDLLWEKNLTEYSQSRHMAVDFYDGGIYISGNGGGITATENGTGNIQTTGGVYSLKYSYPRYPYFVNIPGTSTLINLSEGQIITANPYIIKVKPEDDLGIVRVLFYIDDVLICEVTTPDADGVYSCSWDTSTYHSDVRVVAYDTQGYTVSMSRSVIVGLPETGQSIWKFEILGISFISISIITITGKKGLYSSGNSRKFLK